MLTATQALHAKNVRCVECGHNATTVEDFSACDCCAHHCLGCQQPSQKCACHEQCRSFPCACATKTCVSCGQLKSYCQCCTSCKQSKEECECEDCECHVCTADDMYLYGRGPHGKTETPPWEKNDGIKVKALTQDDSYKTHWEIDTSIDVARAAADFYLLEAMSHGTPNPQPVKNRIVGAEPVASGVGACKGFVTGLAAFSRESALTMVSDGQTAILVVTMTHPEDIDAMKVSAGFVTTTGGTSSHAAVVARGWNKPCVVGAGNLKIGTTFAEGETITIDGETGNIFIGQVSVAAANGEAAASGMKSPKLTPYKVPFVGGDHAGYRVSDATGFWDYDDESNILNRYVPKRHSMIEGDSARLRSILERAGAESEARDLALVIRDAKQEYAKLTKHLAENFRRAAHCAIGGELRHHRCIGGRVLNHNNRAAAWVGWKQVVEAVGASRALNYGVQLFMEMGGSYGGQRWATSAETLAQYEDGELSDALWVDRVWTLTHNGGMLLDKIPWTVKNSKGYSIAHMASIVLPAHGEGNYKFLLKLASPSVQTLWDQYWSAANKRRVYSGAKAQPNPRLSSQYRIACTTCMSKPWIGHNAGCSNVSYGYVKVEPWQSVNNLPHWCMKVEDDDWSSYNWNGWTDGPYLMDEKGVQHITSATLVRVVVSFKAYGKNKIADITLPLAQWEHVGIAAAKTGMYKPKYNPNFNSVVWNAYYGGGSDLYCGPLQNVASYNSSAETGKYLEWDDFKATIVKPYEKLMAQFAKNDTVVEETEWTPVDIKMWKAAVSLDEPAPQPKSKKSKPSIEPVWETPEYSPKAEYVTVHTSFAAAFGKKAFNG